MSRKLHATLLLAVMFLFSFTAAESNVRISVSLTDKGTASNPFYVVAHMTNTIDSVSWAVQEGANALEMDLRFDSNGNPHSFRHGGGVVCDCICSATTPNHVCSHLNGCESATPAIDMFHHVASHSSKLALVIIDSKMDGAASANTQVASGKNLVKTLETELFNKGYKGYAVISAAHADVLLYIQAAVDQAASSSFKSKIFFSFDQEGGSSNEAACTIKRLIATKTKNIVFGTGISACAIGNFQDAVNTAVKNRDSSVISAVYIWTLDKRSSMETYIRLGVNAVITNAPRALLALATEMGATIATPDSTLNIATSTAVVGGTGSCGCDCDYHPGGCVVSKPSPRGFACKCHYTPLAWTCGGSVVNCKDPNSPKCANPDTSVASCILGGGDCDGYKAATCDCNYEKGGCYISKPAPKGTACKCHYTPLSWTCGGSVVKCNNPNSPKCVSPDVSKESCLLGGGDCDAKRYK